jgi:hypothetical protein
MWTALHVCCTGCKWNKTLPAEVVAAAVTRHVVAAPALLDVDAALGALLRTHVLNLLDGVLVFLLLGFAAASGCVPGSVARETEFVLAVGARDLLFGVALGGTLAALDREVFAAFGRETCNEVWVGSQAMLSYSLLVTIFC